jgi:formylglycine-generating enzyme
MPRSSDRFRRPSVKKEEPHRGMVRLPAGSFRMGAEGFYEDEAPVRDVSVESFWIDKTPVTNVQFARFVADTAYVTVAEVAPDPADYPGMDPRFAVPGSIVFTPPEQPVDIRAEPSWWNIVAGADWRHPLGPASDLAGRDDHPVVHIAQADAAAYCRWAGKSLPTEAEWEYAARGGLDGATFAWGEQLHPGGRRMAKTWAGTFPWHNTAPKGLERTSPVRAYPKNGYGLYDLIGNVWEWTESLYDAPSRPAEKTCCGTTTRVPPGEQPRRVTKGGSHLCSPDYCQRYRPAARWPQTIDTATSHLGFRCVKRA